MQVVKAGKILHIVLVVLIALFLSGHFMLNDKKMQQRTARHIERIAQSALGTDVSAGRVQFVYPFGVTIEDLTVYDLKGDTLAGAGALTLRFKPLELLRNRFCITSIRVKSPDIRLKLDSIGATPNYAFITDLFGGQSSESMSLRANSILVRSGSVRYDILSEATTDSLFNRSHIAVSGLTANLSLKAMETDSLAFIIRKLAFAEQSGFRLTRARGAVAIGADHTWLSNLHISSVSSDFIAENISTDIGFDSPISGIPAISGTVRASVTGKDFQAFDPRLASFSDRIILTASGAADGNSLNVGSFSLQSENGEMAMACSGNVFRNNGHLNGSANAYGNLSADFPIWAEERLQGFGLNLPAVLRTFGQTSFNVTADSKGDALESDISIVSDAGTVLCAITGQNNTYTGRMSGTGISLNRVTGNSDLGKCSFNLQANVMNPANGMAGTFAGNVSSLGYRHYIYRNIGISGSIRPDFIISDLNFSDPNGAVALNAALSGGKTRSVSVRLEADSLNLAAYNLTERDSMSLSARFTADLSGHDMDDLTGRMSLDSLFYGDASGNWQMDNLTVSLTESDSLKNISAISDFFSMDLSGNYRLSTLPGSMAKACADILPTIGKMLESRMEAARKSVPSNSFRLEGRLDNTDFITQVLHKPVVLDRPATMLFEIDDTRESCIGNVSLPQFCIAGEQFYDGLLTVRSEDGACNAEIKGLYGEYGTDQTSIRASALAFSDIVRTQYYWNSRSGDIKGYAKTLGQFLKYDRKAGLKSMCILDSTNIIVNGTPWKVDMADVISDSGKISVSGLKIGNGVQHFYADGIISADSSDIMNISMNGIDLDRTLTMLHANGSRFKGTASGEVNLAGVRGDMAFYGHMSVDDFDFMDSYHGHLDVDCKWNSRQERVDIVGHMVDRDIEDTRLTGYYVPKDGFLDMGIDAGHTDLHFLNQWTGSTFKEIGGRALGHLRLFGPVKSLDLEGQAILEDGYFNQEAISTTFIVKRDTLWFEPGRMLFRDVEFYDEKNHDGLLTCILTHDSFSNWKVDMTADVADMQVFNLPKTEMNSFYAEVFAEGSMALKFDNDKGLAISVDAMTAPGTKLGYCPTSGSVADYNFITIVDRDTIGANGGTDRSVIPVRQKMGGNLSLDFNIRCSEDALIDMSISSLSGLFRGNGNVIMTYTPQNGIVLSGIYNMSFGQCSLSFEDIIRKNFTLREGSFVRFNGPPNETELNLLTYHNVNSVSVYDLDPSVSSNNNVRVRCLMDITGNVQDPQLKFDIDMPNGTSEEKDILASATSTEEQLDNQFLYLLTLGRFYTMDYASTTGGLTPSAMESLVNSTVSGQINNLLNQVLDSEKITLSSNISASSYLSNDATNLNNKELEGILEARLLNNRLLVNGNFGYRENTINNTSNFIGDIEVKYKLFPRQGISLKGYNKANDKYFSKTTLTTQGVGIVFEKDF